MFGMYMRCDMNLQANNQLAAVHTLNYVGSQLGGQFK